jgi:transposase
VRKLRAEAQPEQATVRYETGPGVQAQVDWGMISLWIGEIRIKVHLFVMVLGYSRRIFARELRLQVPAFDRSEADARAGHLPRSQHHTFATDANSHLRLLQ